jgi:hypothetical protein
MSKEDRRDQAGLNLISELTFALALHVVQQRSPPEAEREENTPFEEQQIHIDHDGKTFDLQHKHMWFPESIISWESGSTRSNHHQSLPSRYTTVTGTAPV